MPHATTAGKQRYYYHHLGSLKRDLGEALPRTELRQLHQVQAWRHFAVLGRHLIWVALCFWALWQSRWPWLWLPAAFFQGANILGFVVLLHEQVHKIIFAKSRPRWERLLGLLYALPSGISATQFSRWHLDHHNELGHEEHDPKRAHLTPKKNARWLKLLYMTPALFVIYGRAASKEAATYPPEEQRRIFAERVFNASCHLAFAAVVVLLGGWWELLRVYVVPLYFFFPPAFVLNRLGQHFDIDPADPAKWSSRVDGNAFWRFLFLWANFHAEHHYYQRVPFYRLKALNAKLRPFYHRRGIENRRYAPMVWNWLVRNRKAHTDWSIPA